MPELPEVETVRRGLERLIVGKEIQSVRVGYAKMIVSGAVAFSEALPGQVVQSVARRGKYLLLYLTDMVVVSHLRMEGKYLLFENQAQVPDNKHFHVFFDFTDGSVLVYQDVRKFGTMEILDKNAVENYFLSKKLGSEPTEHEFTLCPLQEKLTKSKKPIKSHLLDQTLVAGLGNIYVDEALWRARIHPARPSFSLTETESQDLRLAIIDVLRLGVEKGGSTIRTYRNALGLDGTMQDYLEVYGKAGQICSRCQTELVKIQLGGRGTHFCPTCQENK
ncbi:DNA-formamidopyrimidine glycosylase [Streptococcus sp. X16XC17]|uniref:DNA-formamidopyrimidine glycosylase n=1 Tax=unclassified Streptococcus TaxID=2608887 RepID=UPI00066FE05C|nr:MULTISPECIES: DNA-formamidopyrimidine glycosylase [unclassified Streptococcus]TCD46077.1 DNA-formamidopyrimidine glycosylase [Streptococcus sp. X16XC17]